MQSGNLNLFFILRRLFFFILNKITGLNVKINNSYIENFDVKLSKFDYKLGELALKEFNPLYVLVKEKKFDLPVDIKGLDALIKSDNVNINMMEPFENKIKWKHSDLYHTCTSRIYHTVFDVYHKHFELEELSIYTPQCFSMNYEEIRLSEKVRVFEELISIVPYVKDVSKSILLKVPVVKSPLYKSYFSIDEMDFFRESLAKQNKTKPSNVLITSIYDKFSIELFSSVKQEPATKNLLCYYAEKNNSFSVANYYLLIGERKDNRVSIKSLVRREE